MKKILICFSFIFILFFVLGFIRGRSSVSSPDHLRDKIAGQLKYESYGKTEERDPYGQLVCSVGDRTYRFNLTTYELDPAAQGSAAENQDDPILVTEFPADDRLVIYPLQEIAGGKHENNKYAFAAVVGGISGYSLGYKLATLGSPSIESDQARVLLEDQGNWGEYAERHYELITLRSYLLAKYIDDEQEKKDRKDMSIFYYQAGKKKLSQNEGGGVQRLEMIDFYLATKHYNETAKLALSDVVGSEVQAYDEPSWLSWWWFGIPGLLIAIFSIVKMFF